MPKYLCHKKIIFIAFSFLFLAICAQAQQLKLGNHPTQKEKSAVLELESKNQGLLLTRIADTNNIIDPPDGMIIYFTDGAATEPYGPQAGLYERKNGIWQKTGIALDTAVAKDQSAIKFTRKNGIYVLHIPNATSGLRGVVSSGRQTFSGRKTFKDSITMETLHPGSIIFTGIDKYGNDGLLTEDTLNLFWNNENKRLGLGTNIPKASLDVNGNFKLGEKGAVINNILRDTLTTIADSTLSVGEGTLYSFTSENAKPGASIITSPAEELPDGCVIAYSYSTLGEVLIKIQNSGSTTIIIPENTKFYVTIIK